MEKVITRELIESAYSYQEYKKVVEQLISENKTTGFNQSENNIYFTRLNAERVKRIEKTTILTDEVCDAAKEVGMNIVFLVIAEAWCGDVAQNLPIISMVADKCEKIKLRIILRDENDEVMKHFLTNGGKAIPLLLILNEETLEVLGKWGPRPEPAQEMMREHKKNPVEPYEEVSKNIQLWYARDKGATIQHELAARLESIRSSQRETTEVAHAETRLTS